MENREIKFRAWDHKMYYNVAVDDKGWGMFWDEANGPLDGTFDRPHWERFVFKPIIMQFTGLKDKNGREIFEGDIVRMEFIVNIPANEYMDGFNDEGNYVGQVIIIPSRGVVLKKPIKNNEDGVTKTKNYLPVRKYRSEVIGNIYENPELLKETK